MPEYQSKYVFVMHVQGEDALKEAKRFAKEMQTALLGVSDINTKSKELTGTLKSVNAQAKTFSSTLKNLRVNPHVMSDLGAISQAATKAARQIGTPFTGNLDPLTMMPARGTSQVYDPNRQWFGTGGTGSAIAGTGTPTYDPTTMLTLPPTLDPVPQWWQAIGEGLDEGQRQFGAMRRMGYEVEGFGRDLLFSATAAAGGLALMTGEYLEFNEASTRAGMAMEWQADNMDVLQGAFLDTAESMGAFRGAELAEGVRLWAAGTGESVQSVGQLNRVLSDTVDIQKLAAMNAVDFGTTVDHVGGIMHEFGLTQRDVGEITEVLNYVSAKTFANVTDVGEAFKMVGPVAHSMGMSFSETATALAMLSDQNIKGTMAGRAFRQMMIQMLDPSKEYNEAMNDILGTTQGMEEAWRQEIFPEGEFIGMAEYIGVMADKLSKYNTAEKNRRLAMLATANALPSLIALVNSQIEVQGEGINVLSAFEKTMNGIVDQEVLLYKAWYEETTGLPYSLEGALAKMTGMWDTFVQSDQYRVEKMRRQWETATIRIGGAFLDNVLPAVETVVNTASNVSKFFEENPWARDLAIGSVGATAAVGAGMMGAGWTIQVAANMGILATALKSGAFTALAPALGALTTGGLIVGLTGALTYLGKVIVDNAAKEAKAEQDALLAEQPEEVRVEWSDHFVRNFLGGTWRAESPEAQALVGQVRGTPITTSRYPDDDLNMQLWLSQLNVSGEEMADILAIIARKLRQAEIALDVGYGDSGIYGRLYSGAEAERPFRGSTLPSRYQDGWSDSEMDMVNIWQDHAADMERVDSDLAQSRQSLWENYNTWYERAQRDLGRNLAKMDEDYLEGEEERQADHQDRLREMHDDYLRDQAKAQADHDLNLRRMAEDHRDRLIDLLEEGDVRGITKEMGQYRKDKSRAIEDFGRERAEADAEHTRKMQEQDQQFAEESAKRKEQQDKRRADAIEALELQRQDREEDARRETARMEQAAAEEKRLLEEKVKEELAIAMGLPTGLQAQYEIALRDAKQFMADYYDIWKEGLLDIIDLLNPGDSHPEELTWAQEGDLYSPEGPPEEPRGGRTLGGNKKQLEEESTGMSRLVYRDPYSQEYSDFLMSHYGSQSRPITPAVSLTLDQTFTGMGAEDKEWYKRYTDEQIDSAVKTIAEQVKKVRRGSL